MSGYFYAEGAAHGLHTDKTMHIDAITGEFYQLADLFKEECDLQKLFALLQMQYDERRDEEFGDYIDLIPQLEADQNFYLSNEGLEIYFRPYIIAPYVCGFPSFVIKWEEIDDIIDAQSKLLISYKG